MPLKLKNNQSSGHNLAKRIGYINESVVWSEHVFIVNTYAYCHDRCEAYSTGDPANNPNSHLLKTLFEALYSEIFFSMRCVRSRVRG